MKKLKVFLIAELDHVKAEHKDEVSNFSWNQKK